MRNADDAMLLTSDPDLSDSILRQFETAGQHYLFIYLIRHMAANSKIHNEHKSQ